MDLRNEERIAHPDCFVCRWAGRHIIIWPQERSSLEGWWKVYSKVEETIWTGGNPGAGHKIRSRHHTIQTCVGHNEALYANWMDIARQELILEDLWNKYTERTEQ